MSDNKSLSLSSLFSSLGSFPIFFIFVAALFLAIKWEKILIKYIYQWRKEWENIQNTLRCLKLDFEINKKIDFILLFNYDWNKRVYLPWFLIYPHLLFCLHLESLPLKETIKIDHYITHLSMYSFYIHLYKILFIWMNRMFSFIIVKCSNWITSISFFWKSGIQSFCY